MIPKKTIAAMAISLSAGASHAWTLAYAHDTNGIATAGSLQGLRNAASNGASVKAVAVLPGDQDFQLPCAPVSIHMGATQEVVCIGSMDLRTYGETGAQFGVMIGPPQSMHFKANTAGQFTQNNINLGTGALMSTSQTRYAMRWYVQ